MPMPISTPAPARWPARCGTRARSCAEVLELVSWLVASARTTTAMVCVPALPPMPETIGISTASSDEARDLALEQADDAGGEDRGAEVDDQPGEPARTVSTIGSLMSPSPAPDRRRMSSLGFLGDDVDDVVDGDHADQPAALVDHRGARSARISGSGARLPPGPCRPGSASARASSRRRAAIARGVRRIQLSMQVPTGLCSGSTTNTSQNSVVRSSRSRR